MSDKTVNYLETFESWLLIVFSDDRGYHFQAFNPAGKKVGEGGIFDSVALTVQLGRKFITRAKLK